jgi:hypothetical protein
MSQNDFNIANQGFPSFRSDLNDALQALASNSSGATEPATTYAGQFWYDSTNNVVKFRNEANSAWIDPPIAGLATSLSDFGVTASAAELNKMDGVTATTAEINYIDGVTSNIQTQLNAKPDTDTTYSADGNYGMTLSGTAFRLEDDRRRNSTTADIYSGNTHDYTFYDASVGICWYTAGAEEMRLEDDGDLHVGGNVIAYSTTISDERLKTDIVKIDGALDKVAQLNGYTFTYTADGKKSAGVIAQEVQKVLPSAIVESTLPLKMCDDDGTEYMTVQYDQLIGLLVEAVKELKAEVAELKGV